MVILGKNRQNCISTIVKFITKNFIATNFIYLYQIIFLDSGDSGGLILVLLWRAIWVNFNREPFASEAS